MTPLSTPSSFPTETPVEIMQLLRSPILPPSNQWPGASGYLLGRKGSFDANPQVASRSQKGFDHGPILCPVSWTIYDVTSILVKAEIDQ